MSFFEYLPGFDPLLNPRQMEGDGERKLHAFSQVLLPAYTEYKRDELQRLREANREARSIVQDIFRSGRITREFPSEPKELGEVAQLGLIVGSVLKTSAVGYAGLFAMHSLNPSPLLDVGAGLSAAYLSQIPELAVAKKVFRR